MIRDRSKMKWNGRDALVDEIQTLERLRSAPNVVYMHDYFMDPKQCFLILELLPGKELFDRIIQRGTYTEEEARNSCRCILEALAYMHERRMTHRDLKPENLLLAVSTNRLTTQLAAISCVPFGFEHSPLSLTHFLPSFLLCPHSPNTRMNRTRQESSCPILDSPKRLPLEMNVERYVAPLDI